jgi:hypothetical protein
MFMDRVTNEQERRPVTLTIRGLGRNRGDVAMMQRELSSLDGVESVFINPESDFIHLAYHKRGFNFPAFMKIIERLSADA